VVRSSMCEWAADEPSLYSDAVPLLSEGVSLNSEGPSRYSCTVAIALSLSSP
jgi:hypothetical protein